MGGGVLAPRCRWTYCEKCIKIKMFKKFETKFGHPMFAHKFSGKRKMLCGLCKEDKKCPVNSHVGATGQQNAMFSRKLVWEHRMSRCACEYIFILFWHFEICFQTMGSYAPREPNWISWIHVLTPITLLLFRFWRHELWDDLWTATSWRWPSTEAALLPHKMYGSHRKKTFQQIQPIFLSSYAFLLLYAGIAKQNYGVNC
jgi:hypothetical protein